MSWNSPARMLQHLENEEVNKAAQHNVPPQTVQMIFKRGYDQRRSSKPHHDEVAAIFVGPDGAPPLERDIVVYPRNAPLTQISYMSANCDPMVYPVLFPKGDLGWVHGSQQVLKHSTQTRHSITLLQYYSFRLAVRSGFSTIHSSQKLFQQYLVDAYVKTEAARLDFLRRNQKALRVELYQGLMDHLHSSTTDHSLTPGKIVILPSSYHGSPRAMQQNYQDAMALVAKFGKPDLFLTFTCNPKCKEITENLAPGQHAQYRPDLIGRVFHRHLQELLKDIKDKHVLGKPVAFVYVIEFQKRGLPHCHMLIILEENSKLRDKHDTDSIIFAEIPDPESDAHLYDIVKSCMIHGPCGTLNPKSVCMENGVCTKGFPKEFAQETSVSVDGYPRYRRSDNGRTVRVHTFEVDNRFVVPYNPWMLKKYQAHINLEACMTVKSVKYLFKYIYKGHNTANIEILESNSTQHDEISTFLDARYVSPPEAFWRLSEYPLHSQSHTVIRLPVHLPQQQPVYFTHGQEEQALQRASNQDTQLTAWFKLNEQDDTSQHYLYPEIPCHFVFNTKLKQWQQRKRRGNTTIPRMYSVSPKDGERFYLRRLLLHVPGAKSFQDLRTVQGVTANTFQEACQMRHLLADDKEWDDAVSEASVFQMPHQLRLLFATICSHCEPSNPLQLWQKHKTSLTEDYLRTLPPDVSDSRALADIEDILLQSEHTTTNAAIMTMIKQTSAVLHE